MLALYLHVTNWLNEDRGQDLIEYALLAALIAVALIAVLLLVAPEIEKVFSNVVSALGTTPGTTTN